MFNKLILCFSAIVILLLSVSSVAMAGGQGDDSGLVTIESWAVANEIHWNEYFLPAFRERYPDVEIEFTPVPGNEYNSALEARFESGTAGDLIQVRYGLVGLNWYKNGNLVPLNDFPGIENFGDLAKNGWSDEDGTVYAVPMASGVITYLYNTEIFEELGLTPPETHAEFFALLDEIKADGRYVPLAYGALDAWTISAWGYFLWGPSIWGGDAGLEAVLSGDKKFSDPEFAEIFQYFQDIIPYLPNGYEGVGLLDNFNLFSTGQAAIIPAGSWDIRYLMDQQPEPFEVGAFAPPTKTRTTDPHLWIAPDNAIGMNSAAKNVEDARKFLTWMTTPEFANLYSNTLPGFFSLSDHPLTIELPAAAEIASWSSTRRGSLSQGIPIVLQGGTPNWPSEVERLGTLVFKEELTPQEAANELQRGFESWYVPQ